MDIEDTIARLVIREVVALASELKSHSEVDIFYDEGDFFKIATAHNKIKSLKILFEEFNKRLSQYKSDEECVCAKLKLSNILKEAIDSSFPSEETIALLKPYMYEEDDSDSRQGSDLEVDSHEYYTQEGEGLSHHLTIEEVALVPRAPPKQEDWLNEIMGDTKDLGSEI
ncbi:MAG: hypothetical protein V4485_04875 [Pseudomonadota bacterium]